MWEWVGAIALDPNPFTIMSMDLKLDKELSHIGVRIKAMGPRLEMIKMGSLFGTRARHWGHAWLEEKSVVFCIHF